MDNLTEVRTAFQDYRKNDTKSAQLLGLTPDIMFDETMVNGLLSHVLAEMKVQAKPESVLASSSNVQVVESVTSEQKLVSQREDYDSQHIAACLSADQNIQAISIKANERIKLEENPCNDYTQSVRKKFLLLFSMFAVSAKQQQASSRKDFFQQLADHLKSSKAVEKRVQIGLDFACQFQLSALQQMTSERATVETMQKIYDLLKQAGDGDLFGHDKFSFIIDKNLDQISTYLQSLLKTGCSEALETSSLRVLMQLGRVRSNPADYLACINARDGQNLLKVDLSADMGHIYNELSNFAMQKECAAEDSKTIRPIPNDFKEAHSINRGTLFYYKAGQYKLDITSLDGFATDGHNMYHLKRGRGLFKLGFGDGIQKMCGFVKEANTSDAVKSMESTSMVLIQDKLYIRHYNVKPYPFEVYDCHSLQLDQVLTSKFKTQFDLTLKSLDSQIVEQPSEENSVPATHRSLLWHKDSKSGRTLEITPMFTDGVLLYCVAFQKQADKNVPMLVVELYNLKTPDLAFVRQIPLFNSEGTEPFVYDSNNLNFIRSSHWFTNGQILAVNVPNASVYFFDLKTGGQIAQEKSDNLLICHDIQSNKIFSVRSLQGTHQTLFEVAFNGLKKVQSNDTGNEIEKFNQAESTHISELMRDSLIKEHKEENKYDSLIESIVFGPKKHVLSILVKSEMEITDLQIQAQHTLILKYLDVKRSQAVLKLAHLDFINVFKYPNVTYLSGPTFSALIQAAAQQDIGPFDILYALRMLQCNFTALIMCQGSLPEIMRDNQDQYKKFFELYNSVLRTKVYQQSTSLVESEIQSVCIEIMSSSINILYETNQEIVNKFLSELQENSSGINCNIFFDFFSQAENFEKLLNQEIKGAFDIFEATCQIQFKFLKRKLLGSSKDQPNLNKSELASSRFLKVCAQHIIIAYCNLIEKISDRQKTSQKVPQQLVDKYSEEDNRLVQLQTLVFAVFKALNSHFNESIQLLRQITVPVEKEEALQYMKGLRRLLLQKSPFAQMYLNVYCQIFTVLNLELDVIPVVVRSTLEVITSLQEVSTLVSTGRFGQLWTDLLQVENPFGFLDDFVRTLSYLVSSKAYVLTKSEAKKNIQNTVETQMLQSNVLSGGIDPSFEAEFSPQTKLLIGQYSNITQVKPQVETNKAHDTLVSLMDPTEGSDIQKALDLLQSIYAKEKGQLMAMIGREAGLKLSRAAFAVLLKLQDQQEAFSQLVELQDVELLEPKEKQILSSLYSVASQMRKWTHEAKNSLSERIDAEIELKHRKEKEAKHLTDEKVVKPESTEVQIDTMSTTIETSGPVQHSVKFFSEEELEAIKNEQDKVFTQEIGQLYESVIEKAKYLIKIQSPSVPIKSQIQKGCEDEQSDLLRNWKETQKEMGNIRSHSTKEKDIRISCSGEVLTILQLSCSVQRIQQQVEEVYVAAHRRVAGLYIFQQLVELLVPVWSNKSLSDTLSWFCAALRDNKNTQVHYLQGLTGCGLVMEASARDYFFKVLIRVVEKLQLESNTDQEMGFLISCLKWKFLGRDHDSLCSLKLFTTLHQSKRLKIHWGKPVATDFSSQGQGLKFNMPNGPDSQAMVRTIFDRHDGNKNGALNYAETKEFFKELSNQFGQSWDQNEASFDQTFNKIQKDNRVGFEVLFKNLQLKKITSSLAKEMLSLFELLFSSSITRLIESDVGVALRLSGSLPYQLNKAKSVVNHNKSDILIGEMFGVVFQEFSRYLNILQLQKGVDWTIYAQKRSTFAELFDQSVDEYELIDVQTQPKQLTPTNTLEKVPQAENDEERKARELLAEQAKLEERQKAHLRTIPQLYSESFLLRLLRLVQIFTSVSACVNNNLFAMVQRIANPNQMAILLSLLVQGTPKIKISVLKIFTNLVKIEFPIELYEETMNLHLSQPESVVAQVLKRIQPTIQFNRSKFLAFIHHYVLSIRQKLWTKSAIESEGQYEISCELLKFMRTLYESQKSENHPWRVEINEVISQTLSDTNKLLRARETEVLLGILRGADFSAISPYSQVYLKGKQKFTVLGFVDRDWLKRSQNTPKANLTINATMTQSEQKVLLVNEGKGELLKLVNPERINLTGSAESETSQFQFSVALLKSLFDSTNLASGSSDDIQQLSNKCLLLKMLDSQLQSQPKEFIAALRNSGHYETLFKLVGKESSLEIKGDIVMLSWLEQHCYNIRKVACENQNSLLKPQEAQMTLVKDKIYAFAVNPNSKGDKSYLRVKLLSALNYGGFVQLKDTKLVCAADMLLNQEEERQSEQLVALVDPSEFQDGNGLEILNRSIGIVTHTSDLNNLMTSMTNAQRDSNDKYQGLMQKTIFLVSPLDFVRLTAVCSGETTTTKNERQESEITFDQVYCDELVAHGGFTHTVAAKTKQAQGVENKTKALFDLIEQINSGQIIPKEEEQLLKQSDIVRRDKPAEETQEIVSKLIQRHQETKERQHPDSARSNLSTFFNTTKLESTDLADLYEKSIRRLFNMLCRNIFWNLIQKDKIAKIFDFLLTTPEDMRAFVTFLKVIGNECYITRNKQNKKGFCNFVKQVIKTSVSSPKFHKLLDIIIDDLIDSYRSSLPNLLTKQIFISTNFRTESEASKLMNPNIVIPLLKCILQHQDGFNLIQGRIEELISILITINATFLGDYNLKDKYWFYIIQLVERSSNLPSEKIEKILRLPIVASLFETFEHQHVGDQDDTTRLQRIYREDNSPEIEGIPRNQPWKTVNQRRQSTQRRYTTHSNRSMDHLILLEVLYKFYLLSVKVPQLNYFFNNTLTCYLQMHGSLLQQGTDGEISRHLLFFSQLTPEQKVINQPHSVNFKTTPGPHEITSPESSKFLVHVADTTQLKPGQQVLLTSDTEGKNTVALFNQKQIRTNAAFQTVFADKVYLNVVLPRQNFVVRLQQNELQPENFEFNIEGPILQSYQNRMFLTDQGIFRADSGEQITPQKDHLVMNQVNFGKSCTVALLPNGSIIGFGQSKHRHFVNKPAKTNQEGENVIPLNLKPRTGENLVAQSKEEIEQQRSVVKIRTFKRTTVCLTASGQVYAVGDKFAKQIKLPADQHKAFGFYQLPISQQKPSQIPEVVKPKEEDLSGGQEKQSESPKVLESVLGILFGEDEVLQEVKPVLVVEAPLEEVQAQLEEGQSPVEEVKSPVDEVQASLDEVHAPVEEVKSSIEDVLVVQQIPDQENNIEEGKSIVSDDDYKSVQSHEAKPEDVKEELPVEVLVVSEALIEPSEVQIEMNLSDQVDEAEEEKQGDVDAEKDDETSEYVPKQEEEQVLPEEAKLDVIEPADQTFNAVDVWISDTSSSKHIVVLALFKSPEGVFEFRTIGNNPNGLLGQGKDRKESAELQVIDFGFELKQIDEVVVGNQHFLVRADGKVFAWGCYSSDSEEKVIWQPRELTFFQSHKVKKIASGEMYTCALVEQVGQPDYFICGKFTPLWQENQYKSLKYFTDFEVENFIIQGQNLIVSTKDKAIEDYEDVKVAYSWTPDYTFKPSGKLNSANQETYDKLQKLLTLEKPELVTKLTSLIEAQIYARIKDHNFEDVQWHDINVQELKIDESFGLSDEQKRGWMMLVVNYCKHVWAHLSLVGGKFKKTENLSIYQNFIKHRKNVPMCLKNKYLKTLLQELPKDDKGNSIHISRKRALEMRKDGQVDTKGEWTVFAQVSKDLRKNKFHGMHINSQNKRAWFVKFIGEAALDDGGLFRESITELCSELQSTALELFIPSANQASKLGDNRDKWVLNPQATSDMHLKMYEFVGSLFGMSVRSGILLNLDFAPIFWKTLTKEPLKINDIRDVDLKFVQNLESYTKAKLDGVPEDKFKKENELTMTCLNSAQKVVDLVLNGSKIAVTYQNLDVFIQKCVSLRLNEAGEQYKSILKGFEQTFSTSYLKLLSWQDLELKVVGNEEVDIERLKEITTYSKCSATHDVIKKFWKVLTSFENEDRKKYLRFVWGRTRLPLKEDTDIELHTIQLDENRSKTDTPFGRTCYFRLELPPYQSEAVLRERLIFAITNCTTIDGDYARNYNVDEAQQDQQLSQPVEREQLDGSDSEQERRDDEERQRMRERGGHNDYGSEGSANEDNHGSGQEEE